jgi:hypothetical protein
MVYYNKNIRTIIMELMKLTNYFALQSQVVIQEPRLLKFFLENNSQSIPLVEKTIKKTGHFLSNNKNFKDFNVAILNQMVLEFELEKQFENRLRMRSCIERIRLPAFEKFTQDFLLRQSKNDLFKITKQVILEPLPPKDIGSLNSLKEKFKPIGRLMSYAVARFIFIWKKIPLKYKYVGLSTILLLFLIYKSQTIRVWLKDFYDRFLKNLDMKKILNFISFLKKEKGNIFAEILKEILEEESAAKKRLTDEIFENDLLEDN